MNLIKANQLSTRHGPGIKEAWEPNPMIPSTLHFDPKTLNQSQKPEKSFKAMRFKTSPYKFTNVLNPMETPLTHKHDTESPNDPRELLSRTKCEPLWASFGSGQREA